MTYQEQLSELGDDELFQRLKSKQSLKSWTVGEIYEVERRGFEFLGRDSVLSGEIEESHNTLFNSVKKTSEQVRNFLLPLQNLQIDSASLIQRLNESLGFKKIDWTRSIGSGSIFPQSLQDLTGPVKPEVSALEINHSDSAQILVEATFEKVMREILDENRKTNKLLNRDRVFWLIAVSTCLSAGATIWMLVLTIQNQK